MRQWTDDRDGTVLSMIDDDVLRQSYGPLAGQIGASHWWPIEKVAEAFRYPMGAVAPYPSSWSIDPLMLAAVLRCADAADISSERAPSLSRLTRDIAVESRPHWIAQSKLAKPAVDEDRLLLRSTTPFDAVDANAWWVAHDLATQLDRELRAVDALLADTGRTRFAARSVAFAQSPERLATVIEARDWQPVDTSYRVTDPACLMANLGGRALYGDRPEVVVRELVENGADAVRALRSITEETSAEITLALWSTDNGSVLEVRDTGIGMSPDQMVTSLLDFGQSWWLRNVDEVGAIDPFVPVGRFGVGFASLFMVADEVEVISRRFDAGYADTFALTFSAGLSERPVLRQVSASTLGRRPGTKVRVCSRLPADALIPALRSWSAGADGTIDPESLRGALQQMFPTLDVLLKSGTSSRGPYVATVRADEWLHEDPKRFWELCGGIGTAPKIAPSTMLHAGVPIGRGWLGAEAPPHITVGGAIIPSSGSPIAGFQLGLATSAAKTEALGVASHSELIEWAADQCRAGRALPPREQAAVAAGASWLGIDSADLAVGMSSSGWLDRRGFLEWQQSHSRVFVIECPGSLEVVFASADRLRRLFDGARIVSVADGTELNLDIDDLVSSCCWLPSAGTAVAAHSDNHSWPSAIECLADGRERHSWQRVEVAEQQSLQPLEFRIIEYRLPGAVPVRPRPIFDPEPTTRQIETGSPVAMVVGEWMEYDSLIQWLDERPRAFLLSCVGSFEVELATQESMRAFLSRLSVDFDFGFAEQHDAIDAPAEIADLCFWLPNRHSFPEDSESHPWTSDRDALAQEIRRRIHSEDYHFVRWTCTYPEARPGGGRSEFTLREIRAAGLSSVDHRRPGVTP